MRSADAPGGVDPRRRRPGDRQSADTDGREPEHHEPNGQPHRSQPETARSAQTSHRRGPTQAHQGDPQCASCAPDTGPQPLPHRRQCCRRSSGGIVDARLLNTIVSTRCHSHTFLLLTSALSRTVGTQFMAPIP